MATFIPDFELKIQDETVINSENLKGKYTVLYFYPKDNTPGCSLEAQAFSAKKAEFEKIGAKIIGVSADSVKKHCSFIEKKDLTIDLISDPEKRLIKPLNIWQLKKLAGREYMGIVRTTLILSLENEIIKRWDSVKVKGHIEEVFDWLNNFIRNSN